MLLIDMHWCNKVIYFSFITVYTLLHIPKHKVLQKLLNIEITSMCWIWTHEEYREFSFISVSVNYICKTYLWNTKLVLINVVCLNQCSFLPDTVNICAAGLKLSINSAKTLPSFWNLRKSFSLSYREFGKF